jgi:hypothetical protein
MYHGDLRRSEDRACDRSSLPNQADAAPLAVVFLRRDITGQPYRHWALHQRGSDVLTVRT